MKIIGLAPASPSPSGDTNKDPGMSSRPGEASGQPTDTQKPIGTAPAPGDKSPAPSKDE